jgi:3-hydroxyacyl-[acyl-carrier-protein] dehydratase
VSLVAPGHQCVRLARSKIALAALRHQWHILLIAPFVDLGRSVCPHLPTRLECAADRIGPVTPWSGSTLNTKDLILDPTQIDFGHHVADIEEIRRYNPQRFEMEQLSGIVFDDAKRMICAGYKDITENEFWVRGHMPGMPLMPGVLMCEAAAQLCSYYAHKHKLLGECKVVGFGGMEDVRFRDPVRPGDRLVVVCKMLKVRAGAIIICRFEEFVGSTMVADGKIKGIPLPVDALTAAPKA